MDVKKKKKDWISNERLILWCNEVSATNAPIWQQRIMIHECRDLERFAFLRKTSHGWMVWRYLIGHRNGPCLFWEKVYSGISYAKYCQSFIHLHSSLSTATLTCSFNGMGLPPIDLGPLD